MNAYAGNHTGTAEVNFEYQDPSSTQWYPVIHTWTGSVQVQKSLLLPILLGIVLVTIIMAVVTYVVVQQSRKEVKLEEAELQSPVV